MADPDTPSTTGAHAASTGDDRGPEDIRRDIEQTREEMGDTVEALADKTDVKGQAKAKAEERKEAAREKVAEVREKVTGATPDSAGQAAAQAQTVAKENPIPVAAAGAFAAGFVLGRLTKRR
jgi:ElaB/YqjD/DUF883 family membrane-anchored ribosome-binding protein